MSVLNRIFAQKKASVAALQQRLTLPDFTELSTAKSKFFDNLIAQRGDYKVIAESKKASPSAGTLRSDYDPVAICRDYAARGFTNVSVLTEQHHFGGDYADLTAIKAKLNVDILQKDFICSEWQIMHAKSIGADCILLIAEYLTREQIGKFTKLAASLGLDVLLEFHDLTHAEKALSADTKFIGVNNRNLHTLQTDEYHALSIAEQLHDQLNPHNIIVESGIQSQQTIKTYTQSGFDKFLIGESLLKQTF